MRQLTLVTLVTAVAASLLAACQTLGPIAATDGNITPAAGSPPAAQRTALNYYVLLQADQTSLRDVANDGHNMYLDFASVVPGAMEFFDGEGKTLKVVRNGGLVGVPGVHDGILIRLGTAMSFVSVRAGADPNEAPQVIESKEITQMRERLVAEGPAKEAMMRALAALETGNESIAADFKTAARKQASHTVATPTSAKAAKAAKAVTPSSPTTVAAKSSATDADKPPVIAVAPLATPKALGRPSNWRSGRVPADASPSELDKQGMQGYIAFVTGTLQPVAAAPVVAALLRMANSRPGVLLISGITPPGASGEVTALARQRAEFIQQVFLDEGLAKEKTTLTAVYRTDSHRSMNPRRPAQTVGLVYLPQLDVQASR
ncbi:MAG: hypothetical protein WBD34_21270 [Burkholderiaceae bacterium]